MIDKETQAKLATKANTFNLPVSVLRCVYERADQTDKAGLTGNDWAMARVNSFVRNPQLSRDADLLTISDPLSELNTIRAELGLAPLQR